MIIPGALGYRRKAFLGSYRALGVAEAQSKSVNRTVGEALGRRCTDQLGVSFTFLSSGEEEYSPPANSGAWSWPSRCGDSPTASGKRSRGDVH
jgi:hypothetical protein